MPAPRPRTDRGSPSHPRCLRHGAGCLAEPAGAGHPGIEVAVDLDLPGDVELSCTLVQTGPRWIQPVPFASDWVVFDGATPDPGWQGVDFDDSDWTPIVAPMGFGEPLPGALPEAEVSFLRTSFELSSVEGLQTPTLAIRFDDGVLVWINGVQVFGDNVPPTINKEGPLEVFLSEADLDAAVLVAGTNTVAVQLVQALPADDASFDLRLAAQVPTDLASDPEEVHLVRTAAAAAEHTVRLFGLLSDSTYTCDVASTCGGAPVSFDVTTDPIVGLAPVFAARGTPTGGTYTLLNHQQPCADDAGNRLFILDPEGRIRWHYEIEELAGKSTIDIESTLLDDGTVLWGGGGQVAGRPEIVALDHTRLHEAAFDGVGELVFHHDVEYMPDGSILTLVESEVSGGTETWEGFDLIQYDPVDHSILWHWKSQDAYDVGTLPGGDADHPDPYHANSLVALTDDHGEAVYVTLLRNDQIVRIDRQTGEVSWSLGYDGDFSLVDVDGNPLGNDSWWDAMHAIDVFADGRIFLYDNGRNARRTRAVILDLDLDAQIATVEWSFTEAEWYEPVWGDADELPNGNVAIAMAHAWCYGANRSHPGALVEVDRVTREVVWRLDYLDTDDSTYRAERIDGCALFDNTRYCPGNGG